MSTIPELLVEAAVREVGVREQGGNNKGARIFEYGRATWMPEAAVLAGIPWCAAFCCFVLRAALIKSGVPSARADAWRCRDASAFGWLTWGNRAPGCRVLAPDAPELHGDLVVFDFNGPTAAGGGHIGIVERALPGAPFESIEGNTGAAGLRETTDGSDGVVRKVRANRSVIGFIRLPASL